MNFFHRPSVVSIGVHIVDALGRPVTAIPDKQGRQLLDEIRITVAGTAAGTAVDLAKLGAGVVAMGAIGEDLLADFLCANMIHYGVDVSRLTRKPGVQTSASLLLIRPNGERPALHCPGAEATLEFEDIDFTVIETADAVHLGGPDVLGAFGRGPALEVLTRAQAAGAITTVDVLSRGDGMSWEELCRLLSHTDYFLPNDDQLRRFTGIDELAAAARKVLEAGPRAVLVSCGAAGSLLVTADREEVLPSVAEAVVDTTGCGDGVTAGFLIGVLRGWPLIDAAWLGMAVAAYVSSGLGSDAGDYDLPAAAAVVTRLAPEEVAHRVRADLSSQSTRANIPRAAGIDMPVYADLPTIADGGRSGWGLFGLDDNVGLFNLQTPERVRAAARLIRTGEMFALNAPITTPDPPLFGRSLPIHTILPSPMKDGYDDKIDDFYPQASSQWDALAHVGYDVDVFYNGATNNDINLARRNTIDHWARRGIAGRALLLDVDALLGGAGIGFDPSETLAVKVSDLEAARVAAGVEYKGGDVVLLHTGYLRWFCDQSDERRRQLAETASLRSVGIDRSEEMVEYLWDNRVVAIAGDNPAVEVWPPEWAAGPRGFLHRILIGQLGMAIGELWWLDELARSCRQDGRYEMFLTSAPLNVPGGTGSPANALALK